ncbi:hypothetical protein C0J52_05271 [Blattella germanica]|nr:hypothetical protein C0J52_05271 [Blattella germanica]
MSPPGKPLAQSSPIHTSEPSYRRNDFNLQDFIVRGTKPNRKKSPSRKRINPTRVAVKSKGFGSASLCEQQSSLFNDQPMQTSSFRDFEEERTLLRKERARHQIDRQILVSPAKMISCIDPDPSLVSSPNHLRVLADMYCCLLDHNLVLNLMTELCFVMGLLVIQSPIEKVDSQYFNSVHDCVYFATSVLSKQRQLLQLFDKVTLKMLADNKQISTFSPELYHFITELLTSSFSVVKRSSTSLTSKTAMNVSFQLDTDNRQNFPSDQAFHVFRKQRDGLYDILRTWEANHLTSGWSFAVALGPRIRSLLGLHDEASNFVHFARLFRSQLLGSTKCNESSVLADSEIDILKEVHPDKLNRLNQRLVTPIHSGGSNQRPTFPGHQEFYRDFIIYSHNPVFIQHLSDSLAAEISLNPCLDVLTLMKEAVQHHKLVLTVPWVVEYLCFLDPVATHIPYFRDIFTILFQICRNNQLHGRAMLLIRLSLGRLFESQNFPAGLFYSSLSQHNSSECSHGELPLDHLDVVDEHCLFTCCPNIGELKLSLSVGLGPSGRVAKHITPISASLNQSNQSAARQLELQLEESFFHAHAASLRKTVEFVAERVASCCVKHVCNTLLPTVKQEGTLEIAKLCSEMLKNENEEEDEAEVERLKESLSQDVFQIASKCCTRLKKQCDISDYCEKRSKQVLPLLLPDDILSTVLDACVQIASRQSRERVSTWIHSHITSGLFMKDFQMDIDKAFKKTNNYKGEKMPHRVPLGGRTVTHTDEAISPTQAIMQLRVLMWKLLDGEHEDLNEQQLLSVLQVATETPLNRGDLIASAERLLPTMLSELALLLVAHRPDLMHASMIEKFTTVWQKEENNSGLANLLCPRNVLLLSQSKLPPTEVWTCFAKFLTCLLTKGHFGSSIKVYKRSNAIISFIRRLQVYTVDGMACSNPSDCDRVVCGMQAGAVQVPVFVYPSPITFYVDDQNSHKQVLTLYNPYEFPIRFRVLCTAPNKYSVVDPEGSVRPKCCIDIVVRHNAVSPANCNVVDKFRVHMQNHTTRQLIGKQDITATLLPGRPSGSQSDGEEFQRLPPLSAATSVQQQFGFVRDQRQGRIQTPNYVILAAAFVCMAALLMPTQGDQETKVPTYLHLTPNMKLVLAYALGNY